VAGRSKVLHYTTIHTQPWQPFPEHFVYQRNPVAHVWLDMERAADVAHYQLFSAERPSARYETLSARPRTLPDAVVTDGLEELLAESGAASVLEFQLGPSRAPTVADRAGRTVTRCTPMESSVSALPDRGFDAVVCAGALAALPEEDIPWLLESLFRSARRCCYLSVSTNAVADPLDDGVARRTDCSRSWWLTQVERASACHPAVHWKLVLHDGTTRRPTALAREGGRRGPSARRSAREDRKSVV
jgi:hypothetical protein